MAKNSLAKALGFGSAAARDGGDDVVAALRATCDLIEADLTATVQKVVGTSHAMQKNATTVVAALGAVDADAREITAATSSMHHSATTVAAAVEELNASAREIQNQAALSSQVASDATAAANHATACMRSLEAATERIDAVVSLIDSIASRTNLLALNATIEATRAGKAGLGFAVVAHEVKTLSSGTRTATDDIRRLIAELKQSARASIGAVEDVARVNTRIEASATNVRAAVSEQTAAIDEIARSAALAAGEADAVSAKTRDIVARITDAARMGEELGQQTKATTASVEDLQRRLVIGIRESAGGNRRRHDRLPSEERGTLRVGNQVQPVVTVDLSEGGALLRSLEGLPLAVGQQAALTLDRIGTVQAVLRGVSSLGAHVAFDRMPAGARDKLKARLAEILRLDSKFVDRVKDTARRVEAALEAELAAGRLSLSALFNPAHDPVAGTDPVQFDHAALAVLERVLPAIQEPVLSLDKRVVFCATVDRTGYLPVHNDVYSQPQRPGDPVWNAANCRNRRIFDDRAGLLAARNTRPFLLQAYQRNMGGGELVMMKEADAPVHVAGRHFGAVRLAYRY